MGASGAIDANKQGGGGSGMVFQLDHFRMEVAVATGHVCQQGRRESHVQKGIARCHELLG